MTFTEACGFVMPIGKYKGRTIAQIAQEDGGLRYLDWLVNSKGISSSLREAMQTYLKHPQIARQVDTILED